MKFPTDFDIFVTVEIEFEKSSSGISRETLFLSSSGISSPPLLLLLEPVWRLLLADEAVAAEAPANPLLAYKFIMNNNFFLNSTNKILIREMNFKLFSIQNRV